MADLPAWLMPHKVQVQTRTGEGARGPIYGDPIRVQCMLDSETRTVVGPDGEQTVTAGTIYASLEDADKLAVKSVVDIGNRKYHILTCNPRDDGGLGAWQHTEATFA